VSLELGDPSLDSYAETRAGARARTDLRCLVSSRLLRRLCLYRYGVVARIIALVIALGRQKVRNRRQTFNMTAEDFDSHHKGYSKKHSDHAPQPAPERNSKEERYGI
jgi:hypothetical protein